MGGLEDEEMKMTGIRMRPVCPPAAHIAGETSWCA